MKYFGCFIVWLYWKFGYKHDFGWRSRLIAHFIPTLANVKTPGTLVVSEMVKDLNKPLLNPLAEITIHGIAKPDFVSPDIFSEDSK